MKMEGEESEQDYFFLSDVLTEDKEFLEDLLAAAVNDAVRKVEENSKDALSSLTGGINLPPGFKMPF